MKNNDIKTNNESYKFQSILLLNEIKKLKEERDYYKEKFNKLYITKNDEIKKLNEEKTKLENELKKVKNNVVGLNNINNYNPLLNEGNIIKISFITMDNINIYTTNSKTNRRFFEIEFELYGKNPEYA